MTKAKVTNNSSALQGVRSSAGVVYIKPGMTRAVEFEPHELERAQRRSFLTVEVEATEQEPEGALVAKHKGAGKYSIWAGDEEVSSGLSKTDAETFNAMSDEDKAAFVGKDD